MRFGSWSPTSHQPIASAFGCRSGPGMPNPSCSVVREGGILVPAQLLTRLRLLHLRGLAGCLPAMMGLVGEAITLARAGSYLECPPAPVRPDAIVVIPCSSRDLPDRLPPLERAFVPAGATTDARQPARQRDGRHVVPVPCGDGAGFQPVPARLTRPRCRAALARPGRRTVGILAATAPPA